jgi:hypothetical protein
MGVSYSDVKSMSMSRDSSTTTMESSTERSEEILQMYNHEIDWKVLEKRLYDNVHVKKRGESKKQQNRFLTDLSSHSISSRGISVSFLCQWWAVMVLKEPSVKTMTIAELCRYFQTEFPCITMNEDEENAIPFFHFFPVQSYGFPDLALILSEDYLFNDIINVIKCYSRHSYQPFTTAQFIWIEFLAIPLHVTLDLKQASKRAEIINSVYGGDVEDVIQIIPNVHFPYEHVQHKKLRSRSFGSLGQIWSLLAFGACTKNGGRFSFLSPVESCSVDLYRNAFLLAQAWKPQKALWNALQVKDEAKSLSEEKDSFSTQQLKTLQQEILSVFTSWNTFKLYVTMLLLKQWNCSPVFFRDIAECQSLSPKHQRPRQAGERNCPLTIDADASYEEYIEQLVDEEEGSIRWKQCFPRSEENWKQFQSFYDWFYYDYKVLGKTSYSVQVKI